MNLSYDTACFFSNHFKEILKHFGCLAVHITLAPDFYLYKAQAGRLWPNGISDPTSYH